jgi:hypothetical protein
MKNRILQMWRDDLFKVTVRPFLAVGVIWLLLQVARAFYREDLPDIGFSVITFLILGSVAVIWWIRNKA